MCPSQLHCAFGYRQIQGHDLKLGFEEIARLRFVVLSADQHFHVMRLMSTRS